MADTRHDLHQALNEFVRRRQTLTTFLAQVTAVNETDLTCDVKDDQGIEIYDVRMRATVDGSDDGAVLIPSVDSWVVVASIGNSESEYVVIATSSLSKVLYLVGTTRLEMTTAGVLIERNNQTLRAALDALVDAIKLITVTCAAPGAPSTIPINAAAFDAVKAQIAQILKS